MSALNLKLSLDKYAYESQNSPEARTQQDSGNCPTRAAVTTPGRFCERRTIAGD
jgi:hypothetical protein